jgi:hypothetical protein
LPLCFSHESFVGNIIKFYQSMLCCDFHMLFLFP